MSAAPTEALTGLSPAEAARRLALDGPNALPGSEAQSLLGIVASVVLEPMFLMLLAAGLIYLALGDTAEAIFLLGAVFVVIGLALAQQHRTQRALEALRDLSAPRALVIRDSRELRVASRELVVGDVLVLHEGDRIGADALLLSGHLAADESLLSGESVPVDKLAAEAATDATTDVTEGAAQLFASTLVTRGWGLARVNATGARTAVGRIGLALASTALTPSTLQRDSRRIVRWLAVAGLALAAGLVLLAWQWDGRPLLESLLMGVALAMAILPEEIPVVLTVFLALGAWRLSRQQVLTRRVQAVEALGAITVLAVDKTGTLTQNRMALAELWLPGQRFEAAAGQALPLAFHELAETALLATPTEAFDPMEKAILAFGQRQLAGSDRLHPDWQPQRHYPLAPDLLAVTQGFAPAGAPRLVATKGAPEAVAQLCRLDESERAALQRQVQALAESGLRVLAVATGQWDSADWPASQRDFRLRLLGLIALADPPRPQAAAAVATCRRAGIRVLMMTGDHPATARAIARQVGLGQHGLGHDGAVLTGAEVDALDDEGLRQRLAQVEICARLAPVQKLRLVRALQAAGQTVGMTGDGVNDAPALKAADVGIAMGERGTDVAREAAAIVLLDDSFASITAAIGQGRRIDDNLRAAVRFIFAVHVPVIALALGPVLMHWPVLLLPAQIVLLELIIDPACSVLFEAEPAAANLMERAPRAVGDSPFALANLAYGVLQGLGLAAVVLVASGLLVALDWSAAEVRTSVFLGLVAGLFLLVLPVRKMPARNHWLPRLLLAVVAMLALVLALPWLRQVMGLALPGASAFAAVALMLGAAALWLWALRRGAAAVLRL